MLATERATPETQPAETPAAAAAVPPQAGSALWLQRHAGNAATARAIGIQRCGGRPCHCEEDEEELRRGARALSRAVGERRALQRAKSVGQDGRCMPERKITGVVFHPAAEKESEVAKKIVAGSTKALTAQNIVLDLDVKPFLELEGGDFTSKRGEPDEDRMIRTETQLCGLMAHLETMRTKPGVVVLVAPFAGEICSGGAIACYMPNLGKHCGGILKNIKRMILVDTFAPEDELGQVLAHELGHHADWPLYRHPTEPGNYLNFGKNRDHYFPDVLDQMCSKSFQF